MKGTDDIIQIRECGLADANMLLDCGWKILEVRQEPLMERVGFFRIGYKQRGIRTIYVMGCPKEITPMDISKSWVRGYWNEQKRKKKLVNEGMRMSEKTFVLCCPKCKGTNVFARLSKEGIKDCIECNDCGFEDWAREENRKYPDEEQWKERKKK